MNVSEIEHHAQSASGFLKALANPHRLLVLCHLSEGELSVGELEERVGLRQPHLSQHLARLRRDQLVRTRRDSRTIYYSLGSREAERLIALLYDMFCAAGAESCAPAEPVARDRRPRTQPPLRPLPKMLRASPGAGRKRPASAAE
jgi:ArsR family transcriptional regulator, virulence genes transcriptional regulator